MNFRFLLGFVLITSLSQAQDRIYMRQAQSIFAQDLSKPWGGSFEYNHSLGPQNLSFHSQFQQYLGSPLYATAELYVSAASRRIASTNFKLVNSFTRGTGYGLGYVWENPEKNWTYDLRVQYRYHQFEIIAVDRFADTLEPSPYGNQEHKLEIKSEELQIHFTALKSFERFKLGFGISANAIQPYWTSLRNPRNPKTGTILDTKLPIVENHLIGLIIEPNIQAQIQMKYGLSCLMQARAAFEVLPSDMDPAPFVFSGGIRWRWGRIEGKK